MCIQTFPRDKPELYDPNLFSIPVVLGLARPTADKKQIAQGDTREILTWGHSTYPALFFLTYWASF